MSVIRLELGFLGELDGAFLVLLQGIPRAHGPSTPSPLPRGVLVVVIRAVARRAFPPLRGNRCQNLLHYGGIAAKIYAPGCDAPHSCVNLCPFVRFAQESYACDIEGVDADFLLLMAGLVKSGVCSKARCGAGAGMRRTWYDCSSRLLYVEDYQNKGAADVAHW